MKVLRPSRPRGGILVFALMCSAVAVLGLTYWIMTVAGRSRYVDTLQSGTKRRVARDNGRVIAARYMKARVSARRFGRSVQPWPRHLLQRPAKLRVGRGQV